MRGGPVTPEGAIEFYGRMLVEQLLNSVNGVDVRVKWDQVRSRLDALKQLAGKASAQDVRWKILQLLEPRRDEIQSVDVMTQVDVILNELRCDIMADGARVKRPLEELLS